MKHTKMTGAKKNQLIFICVMLALPLLQFIIFTVYINCSTLLMAFQTEKDGKMVFNLMANINEFSRRLRYTNDWKIAIRNSLGYIPVTILLTLPLSLIATYFIHKKIAGSRFFTVIFYLPNVISIVVLVLVFKSVFGQTDSIFSTILTKLFHVPAKDVPDLIYDSKYAMLTLYFYCVWFGIGGNIILLHGAMSRVPESVQEAAALDGCGPFRELFTIFVPLIWPTIATLMMFGVATCFQMFLHTQVMTGGQSKTETTTLAFLIISKLKGDFIDYGYVSFIALIFTLISVPTVRLSKKLFDKICEPVEF